jgi:rare lipoprotein A
MQRCQGRRRSGTACAAPKRRLRKLFYVNPSFVSFRRAAPRRLQRGTAALVALLTVCLIIAGCSKKRKPVAAIPRPVGSTETGVASWYGYPYHGRPAADGEIYDMEKLTAAHRTLPFGTWVQVRNLDNNKMVTVRITDRGPFVRGRIIDLSKAAARSIDMIGPGLARVRLTVVAAPPVEEAANVYAVQVGAFKDKSRAERIRRELAAEYGSAQLVLREGNPSVWRVLVGAEPTIESANGLAARLRVSTREAFVVRLDQPGE